MSFRHLFYSHVNTSWEISPVQAYSSPSFFYLLQSMLGYGLLIVFQTPPYIYIFSNFSTAISAAIITVRLRLCELIRCFSRQVTRTRNGIAGAQTVCVFYVKRETL